MILLDQTSPMQAVVVELVDTPTMSVYPIMVVTVDLVEVEKDMVEAETIAHQELTDLVVVEAEDQVHA